jgi:pimeloyl-ACP methyl ester carboxylesterase
MLVGDLHLPEQHTTRLPGLVVTGSWLTVRGQMATLYASRMVNAGYACLAFDFRGWGDSEGAPRFYEAPARKARDIRSAAAFLQSLAEVDPGRVGALAVCASAGYAALAATEDPALRSIAMVVPWLHDARLVRLLYGGDRAVRERIDQGRAAKARYEATGVLDIVPAASPTDARAAMHGDFAYYLDPTRGAIPTWENKMAVMSWADWLEFDAIRIAPRLRTPTLVVHSERAALPEGAKAFIRTLAAPKAIRWTSGSQFDFFDRYAQVSFALQAAADHFGETLY